MATDAKADTPLVSMKLPPRDKTKEEKMYPSMAAGDDPEYPYGLCLNLDEKQLDQLGLKELPKVGSTIRLEAKAQITGVSENETQSGSRRSLSIQITDLGFE